MQKACRCLLKELDDLEFWEQVEDYLQSLPAEAKVDQEEYEQRLSACKSCENLVNGFCALCGCVVELRAAKRGMHCPRTPSQW